VTFLLLGTALYFYRFDSLFGMCRDPRLSCCWSSVPFFSVRCHVRLSSFLVSLYFVLLSQIPHWAFALVSLASFDTTNDSRRDRVCPDFSFLFVCCFLSFLLAPSIDDLLSCYVLFFCLIRLGPYGSFLVYHFFQLCA